MVKMTSKTQTSNICECGHSRNGHYEGDFRKKGGIGKCQVRIVNKDENYQCECKKFKPQNQSQDFEDGRNSDGASSERVLGSMPKGPDTRKGIFDSTDLDNKLIKIEEKKDMLFDYKALKLKVEGKMEERIRLKAEVEKILDERIKYFSTTYSSDYITPVQEAFVYELKELKKRLGI